jgi:hypothetical protein
MTDPTQPDRPAPGDGRFYTARQRAAHVAQAETCRQAGDLADELTRRINRAGYGLRIHLDRLEHVTGLIRARFGSGDTIETGSDLAAMGGRIDRLIDQLDRDRQALALLIRPDTETRQTEVYDQRPVGGGLVVADVEPADRSRTS